MPADREVGLYSKKGGDNMKGKEQEFKLLLNKDGYEKILSNHQRNKELEQINYYFDTEHLALKNSGITLRIREENQEVILCMKSKVADSLFVTSDETQQNITHKILTQCIQTPEAILELFSESEKSLLMSKTQDNPLKFLGTIKNNRQCIEFERFKIELDHTEFPGTEQSFELEVEGIANKADCIYIMESLRTKNITFSVNNRSKYERFLDAIEKL
jgi:uncharacterized protein YjbK